MRRSRIAWALVTLTAGSTGAWAASLDKGACNVLNAELAGIVAAGARDDMARGPEWAKANLTREELGRIHRLIELEEQLEFRCGMGRNRIVAIDAEPPKGSAGNVVIPEGPEKKPPVKTNAKSDAAKQSQGVKKPALPNPALQKPAPQKEAAAEPPVAAAALKPLAVGAPKPAPVAAAPAATNATPAAAPAVSPAATAAAQPAAAAAPKSTRRQSRAAYVSPAEVNPFFVTRYGDTR